MRPGARAAAAIAILDRWLVGEPVERALTNWARGSRFAGSGDRAAVRDLVYDALRRRRSAAALGGSDTGRGLVLGLLREGGSDPAILFSGERYAPPSLTATERACEATTDELSESVAVDCPEWLEPGLRRSLGSDFLPVMRALRDRAPVWLRVNRLRASRDAVIVSLAAEGIETRPHDRNPDALEVVGPARRLRTSRPFRNGEVELQDIAPQQAMMHLPVWPGMRVLDYCAGGGGKSLALAARCPGITLYAHDADQGRLTDLPVRAERAGAKIAVLPPGDLRKADPCDLVLCDAPCSGSGAWRRNPEGKWMLDARSLCNYCEIQAEILDTAMELVGAGGLLAYATCSLLDAENQHQTRRFLQRHRYWKCIDERRLLPPSDGDGFYMAVLQRPQGEVA
jgi:16S rRNA (cytosine967-C5)-methyltransferase